MTGEAHVPFLTTGQMRKVDRAMVEDYGILLGQMMESAGRNLAHLARRRFLRGGTHEHRVLVLAGTGGNGGGGLVCARRLHNWGVNVHIVTVKPPAEYTGVPGDQLNILQRMSVPITSGGEDQLLPSADLIIDAIIGYSLRGTPTGVASHLIRTANANSVPILALDIPSGLDADTGVAYDPAIRAVATLTLALPKTGLRLPEAIPYVGELYLGDISVPPELYEHPRIGLSLGPIFAEDDIIRLW